MSICGRPRTLCLMEEYRLAFALRIFAWISSPTHSRPLVSHHSQSAPVTDSSGFVNWKVATSAGWAL